MTGAITLYGIPNCDTVKKARAWLAAQGQAVQFHDFKKSGVPAARLQAWIDALGWQQVLNRRGTTWRQLDADVQNSVNDAARALALLQAHPSAIKRPVVEWPGAGGAISVGFDADDWLARLTPMPR